MNEPPLTIRITYDPIRVIGRFERIGETRTSIWDRLRDRAIGDLSSATVTNNVVEMSWPSALNVLRDFGNRYQQQTLNFRFLPEGDAALLIKQFAEEIRQTRAAHDSLTKKLDGNAIETELHNAGFTKRKLKAFQLRDLGYLLALSNGANFSVPGAGKTTVTFALHLLTRQQDQHLFVAAPKSAFQAWKSVIGECMGDDAPIENLEQFTVLDGSSIEVDRHLRSGANRFLMSYDLMTRQADVIGSYFSRRKVHLVLDEAHRMKAGYGSQRGSFLLSVATLPIRRDILTGTPMPQGPSDLAAQLGFLWPGHGLDMRLTQGATPHDVLGRLYVRTTKKELGLPKALRHFRQIEMSDGQLALYSLVKDDTLRQLSSAIRGADSGNVDFSGAKRSVMRLLQLSSNPVLALQRISRDVVGLDSGIVDKVLEEGASNKMRAVEAHARELAKLGRKTVIWTIFTDSILELERSLADLNPVTLYGAVPSGDEKDADTREGRLARFHADPTCKAIIANPAAAGEGISLHTVCHDAIYLDRSYVSTHYLQSIDRIHRLGLEPGVETNIYIYQTKAPRGVGSIDYSVSRRLATKIRGLQQLLDDPDLHEIALDEENADDPVDYNVELQDLIDLVEELEGGKSSPDFEEDI